MKRSIILFSVLIFFAMVLAGSSQSAFTAETGKTCCQKFLVLNDEGSPVSGCTIKIKNTNLSCVTGNTGMCEICFVNDALYTAEVSCPGPMSGSIVFSPCVQIVIIIYVG